MGGYPVSSKMDQQAHDTSRRNNANVMNWMDVVVVVRSKWLRVETINKENGISG